jgi:hypothetical protein
MRVVGYQVPDADDPAKRYSWHVIETPATCAEGSWSFRYPALTCDESPRVSTWLRDIAGAARSPRAGSARVAGTPAALCFLEPNLSLAVVWSAAEPVLIDIGLDLEFAPPWRARGAAGGRYRINCELSFGSLLQAAADWDMALAPYLEH